MNVRNKSWYLTLLLAITMPLACGCDMLPGGGDNSAQVLVPANTGDEAHVISEGNVVPREYRHLSFAMPGRVAEILVAKGEQVSEGQVLARLGEREGYEAALAAADLELQSAQQSLDELNENADLAAASAWQALLEARSQRIAAERAWEQIDTEDYQDDIDEASDEVLETQDDLEEAQKDFDRYKELDEGNSQRKKYEDDLEDAQEEYNEALWARDELVIRRDLAEAAVETTRAAEALALGDYEATRNGPDPDLLALAQARIKNAMAQANAAQAALEDLELIAPFAGTIVDLNITENELVSPSNWAFLLADTSQLYVETNDLTELEVVKIALGQPVSLSPDALPEIELTGVVDEISDSFRLQSGDILYDVRILLEDPDPRLRWGMTVEVTFNE